MKAIINSYKETKGQDSYNCGQECDRSVLAAALAVSLLEEADLAEAIHAITLCTLWLNYCNTLFGAALKASP